MPIRMNLDHKMYRLRKEFQLVTNAFEKQDFEGVKQKALALKKNAENEGIRSCYLSWTLAVAADNLNEMEDAFDHICEASRIDPFDRGVRHSYKVILDQLLELLANSDRAKDDPATPRIYERLLRQGVADVHSHIAMARYHAATGKLQEAMSLIESATLLFPTSREAWKAKAAIALIAGDTELAKKAEASAALIGAPGKGSDC